jgi:hypothetical protein
MPPVEARRRARCRLAKGPRRLVLPSFIAPRSSIVRPHDGTHRSRAVEGIWRGGVDLAPARASSPISFPPWSFSPKYPPPSSNPCVPCKLWWPPCGNRRSRRQRETCSRLRHLERRAAAAQARKGSALAQPWKAAPKLRSSDRATPLPEMNGVGGSGAGIHFTSLIHRCKLLLFKPW